jgi:hypothetical protein
VRENNGFTWPKQEMESDKIVICLKALVNVNLAFPLIQIILLLHLIQFAFSLSSIIALFGCQNRNQDETYKLALVQFVVIRAN